MIVSFESTTPVADNPSQRKNQAQPRIDIAQRLSRDAANTRHQNCLVDCNELRNMDDRVTR